MYNSRPNYKMAVYESLDNNDLSSVTVIQNRDTGVITLSGIVGSADRRARAEAVAKEAAPGYTIDDKIQVDSSGLQSMVAAATAKSKLDSTIEDHFEASIKAHKDLVRQTIHYSAYNGTLFLKGAVKTADERKEAEELAKKVPNVQRVVNNIEVRPGKHLTANS